MKRKRLILLALSATTLIVPICTFSTINQQNKFSSKTFVTENQTSIKNTNYIYETFTTNNNSETIDDLIFDGTTSKTISLIKDDGIKNRKFPIYSKYEPITKTTRNFIVFDIKKYKPNGMDTSEFLKNLHINIDGLHRCKSINEVSNNKNFNIDYNLNNEDKSNLIVSPTIFDKSNNNNLYVRKENNSNAELKLFYKFDIDPKIRFQDSSTGYAYIALDLYHDVVRDKTNSNVIISDKLYINPYIEYVPGKDFKLPFSIPPQKFTISFSSPFFQFNKQLNTMYDSYISDEKDFAIYSNLSEDAFNSNIKDYIYLTSKKNADINNIAQIELSDAASVDGRKIQPLEINTANFYLDDDSHHINDTFNINIKGISISDIQLTKNTDVVGEWKSMQNKLPINTDFNFDISEQEFKDGNTYIEKTLPICTQAIFSEYQDGGNTSDPLTYKYSGMWIKFGITKITPFVYTINKITFMAKYYDEHQAAQANIYHWSANINACRNVTVKVSPNNYNFNEIFQKLFFMQGEVQTFYSTYSSNIFDNSFIIDPTTNKRILSNYQSVYDFALKRFINVMLAENNFLKMANIIIPPDASEEAKQHLISSVLNNPFVQTQYTTNENEFRNEGYMEFRFSPIKPTKFFQTLDFIQRAKINIKEQKNELIDIQLNTLLLNQEAAGFANMQSYINTLESKTFEERLSYLNVINKDTNLSAPFIVKDIKFEAIRNSANLKVTVTTVEDYYMLVNEHLINTIELFTLLPFETVNFEMQSLKINEELLKTRAQEAINYDEFVYLNQTRINDFIISPLPEFIKEATFIAPLPGHEHQIRIEVTLHDEYVFENNTNQMIYSISSINWKGQDNEVQPVSFNFNYAGFAKEVLDYKSVEQFITKNKGNEKTVISKYLTFNEGTIDDIDTITFNSWDISSRMMNIAFQAMDFREFSLKNNLSTPDHLVLTINNLLFKDESSNIFTKVNYEIDWSLLIKSLINYQQQHEEFTLEEFLNEHPTLLFDYNSVTNSVIKLKPYVKSMIRTLPTITIKDNQIILSLSLNSGYFLDELSGNEDCIYKGNYEIVIDTNEIPEHYDEFVSINNSYAVNVEINYHHLKHETSKFKNIDAFIQSHTSAYDLLPYLVINHNDIKKIKNITLIKDSSHSLTISVSIYDKYYFVNEGQGIKTKNFAIGNLVFNDEIIELTPIRININRIKLQTICEQYDDIDSFIATFDGKNDYASFASFVEIIGADANAIRQVIISKVNENKFNLNIYLNNGYYFLNYSPLQLNAIYSVGNVSFKNHIVNVTPIDIVFDGNLILQWAKQFNNFNELESFIFSNNQWKKLFDASIINYIENIYFQELRNHQIKMTITLKDGYIDQSSATNIVIYNIGNILYQNDSIKDFHPIEILFNEKAFYQLMSNTPINSWEDFLSIAMPNVLNFKDAYNGIFWTNAQQLKDFYIFQLDVIDNQLVVRIHLNNGFYFDINNLWKVSDTIVYSVPQLTEFYNSGKRMIENHQTQQKIIIACSIIIPFIILAIIMSILFVKSKQKGEE